MIEQISDGIVSRLKARMPGRVSRIEAFPDKPAAYDFPKGEDAAVFVRYDSSSFEQSDDSPRGTYAPREVMTFQVVYLVRSLRRTDSGPISAGELKTEIRLALHGRSFSGSTPLRPTRHWLDDQKDGVWRWVMAFTCSVPVVADYADAQSEEDFP